MNVSQKLMETMQDKEISIRRLAELTGIPKSAIHRYTNGETEKIPIDRLEKMASALGVDPAFFMGWVDPSTPAAASPMSVPELTPDESALVATYRALNPTGQEVLRTTAQSLALNPDMAAQAPGAAQAAPSLQSAQSPPADRPA
ncbi:MAG: helix-turn-helix transcriptional regulator [Clostridia bacterium]|nr:helix-turn-helix transcriptional regulator [Clostridia bacterium]